MSLQAHTAHSRTRLLFTSALVIAATPALTWAQEDCYLVDNEDVVCFMSRSSMRVDLLNHTLPLVQQLNDKITASAPIAVIAVGGSGGKGAAHGGTSGGRGGTGGMALSVTTMADDDRYELDYYIGSKGSGGSGHGTGGGSGGASSLVAVSPFPIIESGTHIPANLIVVAGGGGGGGSGHWNVGSGHPGGDGGTVIASVDGDASAEGRNGSGQKPGEGGKGAVGGGGRRGCEAGSGGMGGRGGHGTGQQETTWQTVALPSEGPWGRGGNCGDGAGGGGGYGGGGAAGDTNTVNEKASGAGGGGSFSREISNHHAVARDAGDFQQVFEQALVAYLAANPELEGQGVVAVAFSPERAGVDVRMEGAGKIEVYDGAGVLLETCDGSEACLVASAPGAPLRLLAIPDEGSTFMEFEGQCSAQGMDGDSGFCDVTLEGSNTLAITAHFDPWITLTMDTYPASYYGWIKHGGETWCRGQYDCKRLIQVSGGPITLTAGVNAPSQFNGWSGACSGKGACVIDPAKGDQKVTANFY